jgi:hypothetical protein
MNPSFQTLLLSSSSPSSSSSHHGIKTPKGRFVLDDSTAPPRIRAAQGHSVDLPEPVLTPVTDAAAAPAVAVHVTSEDRWGSGKPASFQCSGFVSRRHPF